jgi:16S rRNA processing protein RimM
MQRPDYDPETLLVGRLGRPHGLTGEMVLRPFNPGGHEPRVGEALIVVERQGRRALRLVQATRPVTEGWLIRLQGVESREAAAELTQAEVRIPRSALAPLVPGEYYVEDVVGCAVHLDGGGRLLGTVEGVFWNGAHDVMEVVGATGRHLVPLVPQFVRAVDGPSRKIVVEWEEPEGEDENGAEDGDEDGA